jgi:hypothetical protein
MALGAAAAVLSTLWAATIVIGATVGGERSVRERVAASVRARLCVACDRAGIGKAVAR